MPGGSCGTVITPFCTLGSGYPGYPCTRMHSAALSIPRSCAAVIAGGGPDGSPSTCRHAVMPAWNCGDLGLMLAGTAYPNIVSGELGLAGEK